jgi:glycosyltransferase involved in cell wall biosynthesis
MAAPRRHVIYNPVITPSDATDIRDSGGRAATLSRGPTIVAMGRLNYQKGFDLLIEAFARVAPRHPDWNLLILGEGEQREALERQTRALRLEGRISLPGFVQDPHKVLAQSEIFVLSSRWEGFALALAEAMAAGLPVISFDCPSGPSEYIDHGESGILVQPENPSALANALEGLVSDPETRHHLATRAQQNVARFQPAKILDQWEALLTTATAGI